MTEDISQYYRLLLNRTLDKLHIPQDSIKGNRYYIENPNSDNRCRCWLEFSPALLQIDGNWVVVMKCDIGGSTEEGDYRFEDREAQIIIKCFLKKLEVEPIVDSESVGIDGYIGSDFEKHFFYFSIERPSGGHAKFLPSAF